MTREEAIQILSTRDRFGVPCGHTSGYGEALDMAIEALQTLEAVERIKTEVLPQTDLVRCKDCFMHDECEARKWYGENGFCSVGARMKGGAEE